MVVADEELLCYTPDGEFPCGDSVVNMGVGAPTLNSTSSSLVYDHNFTLSISRQGSVLLRVIADGHEVDSSPTLLSVIERR